MKLIGVDVGTTNCKAGIFNEKGNPIKISKLPTKTYQTAAGQSYYNPEQLWKTVQQVLSDVMKASENESILSIGISSMAEAGLLLDRDTGKAKSHIIPWFDKRTMPQYRAIKEEIDSKEMFKKTGLYPSYKYGLSKILWLKESDPDILDNAVWLSVADYIAYRLTGQYGTDYSLAARTYLFRIDRKEWDLEWMGNYGLTKDNVPPVHQSGTVIGKTMSDTGIQAGIPVSVAGHDHVCAALAVGSIETDIVFDSMGTAETLIGTLEELKLGKEEYNSGLAYGCHVVKDRYFWLGGLSASGGSVEWIRKVISDVDITYQEIEELLAKVAKEPTEILYYPYLSGSGAPLPDPQLRAAFIGLSNNHGKGHLIKAILEGTAFEMESIRRSAGKIMKNDLEKIIAVGGGTNNLEWMQIKSNISRMVFEVLSLSEATLLGAALVAAIGNGFYKDAQQAIDSIDIQVKKIISPDEDQHQKYINIYKNAYMKFQNPLRDLYNKRKVGDM